MVTVFVSVSIVLLKVRIHPVVTVVTVITISSLVKFDKIRLSIEKCTIFIEEKNFVCNVLQNEAVNGKMFQKPFDIVAQLIVN